MRGRRRGPPRCPWAPPRRRAGRGGGQSQRRSAGGAAGRGPGAGGGDRGGGPARGGASFGEVEPAWGGPEEGGSRGRGGRGRRAGSRAAGARSGCGTRALRELGAGDTGVKWGPGREGEGGGWRRRRPFGRRRSIPSAAFSDFFLENAASEVSASKAELCSRCQPGVARQQSSSK